MLISDAKRFLFVHVPKNAGTAVRRSLYRFCSEAQVHGAVGLGIQAAIANHLGDRAKSSILKAVQCTPVKYFLTTGGHPPAALIYLQHSRALKYKSFAFSRNPFDRFVSVFEARIDRNLTFDQFLDDAVRYLQPQVNFLYFMGRRIVGRVGRVEELERDFADICDWLGIERPELKWENATDRGHYRDYYTPKTRKRIEEIYEEDLRAFDYTFSER